MEEKFTMNQRRLRANEHIRELAATVHLSHKEFIQPIFVDESLNEPNAVEHLSGVFSETQSSVLHRIENDLQNGVSKFLLFPVPAQKTENNFVFDFAASVTEQIKNHFGNAVWLANDLCLCSYTQHGHCGILNTAQSKLLNHETVKTLSEYAVVLAQAGSNCIAPSDMSDGRVAAIRQSLNSIEKDDVAIMSYAAKFQSSFFGPFRDVCRSLPDKTIALTDRSTYQIDFRNPKDALASASRDAAEGADILMVKPATLYTDVIQSLSASVFKPIAAYHVSGECAALEMLAAEGFGNRSQLHTETWFALKRAGANIIISYAARHAKNWLST